MFPFDGIIMSVFMYSTPQDLYAKFAFFIIYCGYVQANFTHIPQGYFTSSGAIRDCPTASEVNLKDIGK